MDPNRGIHRRQPGTQLNSSSDTLGRTWVTTIHESESGRPEGCGVVVGSDLILTSGSAISALRDESRNIGELEIRFPYAPEKLDEPVRFNIAAITLPPAGEPAYLALVRLTKPLPAAIQPANLRDPSPDSLRNQRWWAYGRPISGPETCEGRFGDHVGDGLIDLEPERGAGIVSGFSGSGVEQATANDTPPAIVAVVVQSLPLSGGGPPNCGRAITIDEAFRLFPTELISLLPSEKAAERHRRDRWNWIFGRRLDPRPADGWDWSPSTDDAGLTHWLPRARGVTSGGESGYRFRGRAKALRRIVDWIDDRTESRPLLVTGSPGAGKSAILARIVTTSNPALRAALPIDDLAIRAAKHSVAVAVHANGKSVLEIAQCIADAARIGTLRGPDELTAKLRIVLGDRPTLRCVVIDALDEAQSLHDVLRISKIVNDLAEHLHIKVLVGTRRRHADRNLLVGFNNAHIIDLDLQEWFEFDDMVDYAAASLALDGQQLLHANPYRTEPARTTSATVLATAAGRNFLVAGLVGRAHGNADSEPFAPHTLDLALGLEDAIELYLDQIRANTDVDNPEIILAALAHALGAGFTVGLWADASRALGAGPCDTEAIERFRRTPVANFLIEDSSRADGRRFRLFHQALVESLIARRREHAGDNDAVLIFEHLLQLAEKDVWANVPDYLARHLADHAVKAGRLDELMLKPGFLVAAHPAALARHLFEVRHPDAKLAAAVYRLALPNLHQGSNSERCSILQFAARSQQLASLADDLSLLPATSNPFDVPFASRTPSTELLRLSNRGGGVTSVTAINLPNRMLLATGGYDAVVQIWDPQTGQAFGDTLFGHTGAIRSLCTFGIDNTVGLASGSDDGTVRIWDPQTGQPLGDPLRGHTGAVRSVCTLIINNTVLLASGSDDGTVRIWDPQTGRPVGDPLVWQTNSVNSICAFDLDGGVMLAMAGSVATVAIWNAQTGKPTGTALRGHEGTINSVCMFELDSTVLLATAGSDQSMRIWNAHTGEAVGNSCFGHEAQVRSVCAFEEGGEVRLATVSDDETLRIWDPRTCEAVGPPLRGHANWVTSVCAFTLKNTALLASASYDGTVRIWSAGIDRSAGASPPDRAGLVVSACGFTLAGTALLATAGEDTTVRIWDPKSGEPIGDPLVGHTDSVISICSFLLNGRLFLATASLDGTLRIWDPKTRNSVGDPLLGHGDPVASVCTFMIEGRTFLATAGIDGTVRVWNPQLGRPVGEPLTGHTGSVESVCAFELEGNTRLASASGDSTLRIWDPRTGQPTSDPLTGHVSGATSVCAFAIGDAVRLASTGHDTTVRIWDPLSGQPVGVPMTGHTSSAHSVCALSVDGRVRLASTGNDETLRFWDPDEVRPFRDPIQLGAPANAVTAIGPASLAVALDDGVLVLNVRSGSSRKGIPIPTWDVFLAHAGPDTDAARTLHVLLSRAGVDTFLDAHNLKLGDDWDIELPKAQRSARITVVLISEHTGDAFYQREEVAVAIHESRRVDSHHRVIPVYLEPGIDPPYGLRVKHSLTVDRTFGLEDVAREIAAVVKQAG